MIYSEPSQADPKKHAWLGQGSASLTIIMSSSAAAAVVDEKVSVDVDETAPEEITVEKLKDALKESKRQFDYMSRACEKLKRDKIKLVSRNKKLKGALVYVDAGLTDILASSERNNANLKAIFAGIDKQKAALETSNAALVRTKADLESSKAALDSTMWDLHKSYHELACTKTALEVSNSSLACLMD
jgi:chromosome segregation ATPase